MRILLQEHNGHCGEEQSDMDSLDSSSHSVREGRESPVLVISEPQPLDVVIAVKGQSVNSSLHNRNFLNSQISLQH